MPAGGVRVGGAPLSRFDTPVAPPNVPFGKFGDPNSYTGAATQQAHDYDTIMKNYQDTYNRIKSNPINPGSPTPQLTRYSTSQDVDKSLRDLSDLSTTGGYDAAGIAALRERGISPIRSIFSSAQRNVDRAKGLSGGYAPNYAAVTAKMARDQASQIGGAINNVNAGIAQNVASNRIAAAPAYSSAAQRENEARTASDTGNASTINDFAKFNAANALDAQKTNRGAEIGALSGMTNLYGTTPALTKTFGDQIMQATGSNQQQQQIDNNKENQINQAVLQPRFRNG